MIDEADLTSYFAHPPETDLEQKKRVFFEVKTPRDLVELVRTESSNISFHSLSISQLAVAEAPVKSLQALARCLGIGRIWEDQVLMQCSHHIFEAVGITEIKGSWLHPDGKGVKIALLDSGIDSGHPALQGTVVSQKNFLSIENENSADLNFHGTAVAGLIGARGGKPTSSVGGIAPGAQFIDARVFNRAGIAYVSDIIEALAWVASQNPTLILFGGVTLHSCSLDHPLAIACHQLFMKGISIVAPAGNLGPESDTVGCPACLPTVIAVGAVTQEGDPAFFSSRGRPGVQERKPDVIFPGVNIRTIAPAMPGQSAPSPPTNSTQSPSTFTLTGTSAAAAICVGLLALIFNCRSDLSPFLLKNMIVQAAEDVALDPVTQGHGLLNGLTLTRFLNILLPAPSPFKRVVLSSIFSTVIVLVMVLGAFLVKALFL